MKKVLVKWRGSSSGLTFGKAYEFCKDMSFADDSGNFRRIEYGYWEDVVQYPNTTKKVLISWNAKMTGLKIGKEYDVNSGVFLDGLGNARKSVYGDWEDAKPQNIKYGDISNVESTAASQVPTPDKAMRFNSGKTQLSYILEADVAMAGMCKVLEFGAKKYARGNWKKGLNVNEIRDSLLRHMTAHANGELLDPETGLPHVDHITCNAVFLATFGDRA